MPAASNTRTACARCSGVGSMCVCRSISLCAARHASACACTAAMGSSGEGEVACADAEATDEVEAIGGAGGGGVETGAGASGRRGARCKDEHAGEQEQGSHAGQRTPAASRVSAAGWCSPTRPSWAAPSSRVAVSSLPAGGAACVRGGRRGPRPSSRPGSASPCRPRSPRRGPRRAAGRSRRTSQTPRRELRMCEISWVSVRTKRGFATSAPLASLMSGSLRKKRWFSESTYRPQ